MPTEAEPYTSAECALLSVIIPMITRCLTINELEREAQIIQAMPTTDRTLNVLRDVYSGWKVKINDSKPMRTDADEQGSTESD